MLPHEVAAIAGVDPKTISRWAKAHKISSMRTMGGQRRFKRDVVLAELAEAGVIDPPQEEAS